MVFITKILLLKIGYMIRYHITIEVKIWICAEQERTKMVLWHCEIWVSQLLWWTLPLWQLVILLLLTIKSSFLR